MPILFVDQILESSRINEIRKIKIGDKNGKVMSRYESPVVSFPIKKKGGSVFDVDENLMNRIRQRYGLTLSDRAAGEPGSPVPGIPIRFMSDDITHSFHMYRAIYNSAQVSMCSSAAGTEVAHRWFDEKNKGEDGKLKILDTPNEVDCNESCRFWTNPGDEKGKCGWKFMLAVNCEDLGVLPDVTIFRSSGYTLASHLIGSINHILSITGGVLANIPLTLCLDHRETRTGTGEKRRHQVMLVRFNGTMTELRDAAIAELDSRSRLISALESWFPDFSPEETCGMTAPFRPADQGDDAAPSEEEKPVESVSDAELATAEEEEVREVDAPGSAPAESVEDGAEEAILLELQQKIGLSDREITELMDQFHGDVVAVIGELRARFKPSAPAPAPAPEPAPPTNSVSPPPAPIPDPVPVPVAPPAQDPTQEDVWATEDWGNGSASDEPADDPVDVRPTPTPPLPPAAPPPPEPVEENDRTAIDDLMDEKFFEDLL